MRCKNSFYLCFKWFYNFVCMIIDGKKNAESNWIRKLHKCKIWYLILYNICLSTRKAWWMKTCLIILPMCIKLVFWVTLNVLDMTEFIPSAPALTAVLNNDVIQVSWDKPEDNPHRVDHYELYWQGSDSPSTPEQVSLVSQCQKPSNESYLYTLSV